jgi:flagellar protein FliO/FliZ
MQRIAAMTAGLAASAAASAAFAAADAAQARTPVPSVSGGLMQALIGLAVVLALIWGAARVMRRLQPHMAGRPGPLRLVASLAVGQRERVVLIEVGEHWLVAGVAAGSVNALATVPKGEEPAAPAAAAVQFGELFARLRGGPDKP